MTLREQVSTAAAIVGTLAGGGGLYVGGVNANDQATLRLVAIETMAEALAERTRFSDGAFDAGYRAGLDDCPAADPPDPPLVIGRVHGGGSR